MFCLSGALCCQILVRDSYSTALLKNLIVVLVWVILSYINGTLVVIFFRHQVHAHRHTQTQTHTRTRTVSLLDTLPEASV